VKSGTAKRFWLSLAAGALVLAAGYVLPGLSDWVFMPGWLFTSPFWPGGVHSDFGSDASIVAMIATTWIGAWVVWSALVFAIIYLWRIQD
jgi:hypothetical protein